MSDKAPVARTSEGLRSALFDELDGLRNGTSDATRANAVAKISTSIIDTVRLELDVDRHSRKYRETRYDPIAGEVRGQKLLPSIPLDEEGEK